VTVRTDTPGGVLINLPSPPPEPFLIDQRAIAVLQDKPDNLTVVVLADRPGDYTAKLDWQVPVNPASDGGIPPLACTKTQTLELHATVGEARDGGSTWGDAAPE
jgi:hypothetical protein